LVVGSISGGCIESDLAYSAFERTQDGPVVATYDSTAADDVLLGFGLGCNGAVDVLMHRLPRDGGPLRVIEEVISTRKAAQLAIYSDGSWTRNAHSTEGALLVETILPPPSLAIFGAGNDAVPLVRLAKEVGWHVSVYDGRSAYAERDRFPQADVVRVIPPGQQIELEEDASVVLMTHSLAHDAAVLSWLPKNLPYIGVLGPAYRTQRLLDELGIDCSSLYAPIGLDLGAEGPDEIALAIVAEILAVRKKRGATHLKGRTGPLHGMERHAHAG
jgi:xanthine/CO dehydrogenase XdhC/CoxF family maturation factor